VAAERAEPGTQEAGCARMRGGAAAGPAWRQWRGKAGGEGSRLVGELSFL